MPPRALERPSGEATRRRILQAAVARFARFSYEEVKLRDIARDTGVDVAYVHRSFGSKERLFAEVFKATAPLAQRVLTSEKEDIARVFASHVFDVDAVRLRIFAFSLSSPEARKVLRTLGFRDFIEPLAAKLPEPALERAALIAACMTGIRILRDVLRLEPLCSLSREEDQPLIEALFRACLDEKLRPVSARPTKRTRRRGADASSVRMAPAPCPSCGGKRTESRITTPRSTA
jgi:AcrR family transcriptional regulator